MRRLVVAVLAVTFAVVPDVALAAHGQLHGPSSTPLVVELLVAAAVAIAVLGRHAAARVIRSASHVSVDAFRSLTHHLPRARHPSA